MRIIAQRSKESTVSIENKIVGKIKNGMVLLVGITHDDTHDDVEYLVRKIANLRIFEDKEGKTNLSLKDVNGEILSISQFTLYANTKKGNRPSFVNAADPDYANRLYETFNSELEELGFKVEKGIFGADMQVSILNDGPMTIILDSKYKDY